MNRAKFGGLDQSNCSCAANINDTKPVLVGTVAFISTGIAQLTERLSAANH